MFRDLDCTSNLSRYLLTNSFFLLGKKTPTTLSAESSQHPKAAPSVSAIPIELTNSTFHMFSQLINYPIIKFCFVILIACQSSFVNFSHFFLYFFLLGKRTPTPLSPESSQLPKAVCFVSAKPIDLTKRRPGRPSKRDISTRTSFLFLIFFLILFCLHYMLTIFFIATPIQHVAPIGSLSPKSTIHNQSIMYTQNNKSVTKGIYRSVHF